MSTSHTKLLIVCLLINLAGCGGTAATDELSANTAIIASTPQVQSVSPPDEPNGSAKAIGLVGFAPPGETAPTPSGTEMDTADYLPIERQKELVAGEIKQELKSTSKLNVTVTENGIGPIDNQAKAQFDAWRLADQATFGPTEGLVNKIKTEGAAPWIASQMKIKQSSYVSGGTSAVHKYTGSGAYCDTDPNKECWRDNFTSQPLVWDFYKNATRNDDQLRQRVALALQQVLVTSGLELLGTYGFRNFQNMLLENAFTNYSTILEKVIKSPFMGDYLNNVNNDKAAPNENFARELLQLFTLGPCRLNVNGTLTSGTCMPTYTAENVRAYAYGLTGWTYPLGGNTAWGCGPAANKCRFYDGDMIPFEPYHDKERRNLLSGVTIQQGQNAETSYRQVIQSLMLHPNLSPFVSRLLIQNLVSANPSSDYVERVANAFSTGKYSSGSSTFGTGSKGDMAATIAAILLDPEARGSVLLMQSGKLREPILMFTGVLRQLYGITDGELFAYAWGDLMRQHVFRAPSVFNFYPPDFPLSGTPLVAPSFALYGASAALNRYNFLTLLIDNGGVPPNPSVPNAVGTRVDLGHFLGDASDAAKLVDRLSLLSVGHPLSDTIRRMTISAVELNSDAIGRVKTAAYLILSSPEYQLQP